MRSWVALIVLNPMESVSKKDRENGADYLSIMAENLEALKHNFLFRGYFKKQAKEKAKSKTTK